MVSDGTHPRVAEALAKSVDGILAFRPSRDVLAGLAKSRCPGVIDIGQPPKLWAVVTCDHKAIGRMAADHLMECGFRNFGFCPSHLAHSKRSGRQKAFYSRLAEASFRCHTCCPPKTQQWEQLRSRMVDWVVDLPKPVGIMAQNDSLGLQVLEACRVAGLAVPQQVGVLGAGNSRILCQSGNPPLSSVDENAARQGYLAAQVLDELMSGKPRPPRPIIVPAAGVVTRESTGAILMEDAEMAKAIRLIRERACDPLNVEDLLKEVGLSRRSLERRFRRFLGRSPHAEIRRIQLERAKRLLIDTTMSVQQVARSCGLTTGWEISVIFRKHTGLTPTEFRTRHARPSAAQ